MRQVDYAVTCIQRALKKVKCDRFTPALISAEVSDYLIDLTLQHPNDGSDFGKFVISLPPDAIAKALLKQLLPAEIRQTVSDYRAKHEVLQIKKETEIADHNFDNARFYRDQQDQIARSIRDAIASQLIVTPTLIASALRALGYNE